MSLKDDKNGLRAVVTHHRGWFHRTTDRKMRIKTARDLGLRIRAKRRSLGWSQAALAGKIGTSRQWVVAVESGKATVELELVLRALSALGLHLNVNDPPDSTAESRDDMQASGVSRLDAILQRARGGGAPAGRRALLRAESPRGGHSDPGRNPGMGGGAPGDST